MKKETQLKLRTIIREEYQKLLIERLKIENKDWEQMAKLINTRKNGDNIASAIKNKDRAIACFICGHKLDKLSNTNYNEKYKGYEGAWAPFGNRALELGATPEEIETLFKDTVIPPEWSERLEKDKFFKNYFFQKKLINKYEKNHSNNEKGPFRYQ